MCLIMRQALLNIQYFLFIMFDGFGVCFSHSVFRCTQEGVVACEIIIQVTVFVMTKPRVTVEEGELEGLRETFENKEYFSFKGVPYAEPPVGNLRFKAPVPKKPWSGVYSATGNKSACAQLDPHTKIFTGSDDCLYLSVHSPRLPQDEGGPLLPVMVAIHGGGFVMGAGSAEQCIFHMSPDCIVAKDIVVVSINYRLAVLGFLCLDTPDVPGNAGLKDQNLAIKWVKKNIAAFGGDPNKITIFGESAGAASVEYHVISPMSKGLFQKAICQSGSTLCPWARTRDPIPHAKVLAEKLEIDSTNMDEVLKGLQEIEVEKLMTIESRDWASGEKLRNGEFFPFTPIVEKSFPGVEPFLTEEPFKILSSGNFTRVPTISGFCQNEGGMLKLSYGDNAKNLLEGRFIDYVPTYFKIDREVFDARLRKVYDHTKGLPEIDKFLADLQFVGPVVQSLKLRAKHFAGKYYTYMFAYYGGFNLSKVILGDGICEAQHGDDLLYLGSNPVIKAVVPSEKDVLTRQRMVQMWTDFAKHGNPTPDTTADVPVKWIPADSRGEDFTSLEINQDLELKDLPFKERMEVWGSIFDSLAE